MIVMYLPWRRHFASRSSGLIERSAVSIQIRQKKRNKKEEEKNGFIFEPDSRSALTSSIRPALFVSRFIFS
ncbi:hypothetical protein GWI33_014115 [Rhynchophorus ferrugineus]|uniref:Uncharacterized protein n=1 Tax=Rhynchophorus ferrugineus TaxID=354439 RepID=A0A834I239_RHYFE|nr:hypothetical protein GWI33_014115 [Rhynchophorus ferrugineus]